MAEVADSNTSKKPKRKRKVLLAILLLLLLIVLLLQVGVVQQWATDRITSTISSRTESTLTVDKSRLSLRRGLVLDGVEWLGADGDTLLVAEHLDIKLANSLASLRDKRLSIDGIDLRNATLRLHTARGSTTSSLAATLARLGGSSNSEKAEGEPLDLMLKSLSLHDVKVLTSDDRNGDRRVISIGSGDIAIDSINLAENYFIISSIDLEDPIIQITKGAETYEIDTNVEVIETVSQTDTSAAPLQLIVQAIDIKGGRFTYDDMRKAVSTRPGIDYSHLDFSQLEVDMSDIDYHADNGIKLNIDDLSFTDAAGFRVQKLSCENVEVNDRTISLPNFKLDTDRSSIQRSLAFKYRSLDAFKQFSDKVLIDSDLKGSTVAFADLLHFIPSLNNSPFFIHNKDQVAKISGRYQGRINNIRGQDVFISLGDDLIFAGDINTRNITDQETALINLGVKSLSTNISYLHELVPSFAPPDNFYSLGQVNFQGRFDGYYRDFVAYGQMTSDIGNANLDMRLDVKDGVENANYSGEIALVEFDLGAWSKDADLGLITARSSVENGQGLTIAYVKSDLQAVVESFTYRGYLYENFEMDGFLAENTFKGLFSINQEDVAFEFDGTAQLVDGVAQLDFTADIEELDLNALNLSKEQLAISGNLDINTVGNGVNTFTGDILASNLQIVRADSLYQIDTISLIANTISDGRKLKLYSDIADGEISGKFKVEQIPEVIKKILKTNYPFYTQKWRYDASIVNAYQDVSFRLQIIDSKNIFDLIGIPDFAVERFTTKGTISNGSNAIEADAIVGNLKIGDNTFYGTHINVSSLDEAGDVTISIDSSEVAGLFLNSLSLDTKMQGDNLTFSVMTSQVADSLETVNISGSLDPHPKGYRINLNEDELKMLGRYWQFSDNNEIVFGDDYIDITNFSLIDGERTISVIDVNERGVQLEFEAFDFLLIDKLIDYDKISFSGIGDLYVTVDDIFAKSLSGMLNASVPDLHLNDESYGGLEVTLLKGEETAIMANVSLAKDTMSILVAGEYDLAANQVEARGKLLHVPMSIFEMIIPKGIKNTTGTAIANAHLHGPADDLLLDATVNIPKAQTTIEYLGATFDIYDQTVLITESVIDASNGILTDPLGNEAVLTGGLKHKLFKDFTLGLVIESDRAMLLNTTRQDNSNYYGVGIGAFRAEFGGDFDATDLTINCEAQEGTELNIPVQSIASGYDESFIKFVDRGVLLGKKTTEEEKAFELKGMELEMNLSLDPASKVRIIFDENLGDEIVGYGRGDLQIASRRAQDLYIFGEYEIEQGEYLFTALGVVAKAFDIDKGGLVKWTGDPVNATLDINGTYMVDASLQTFIAEYLFDATTRSLASNKTPVALKMDLGGRLYKPVVNFDLAFPELTGELKAYAENKVRTLRENEIALNSQVVGLLAFQTFLPDNNLVSNDVLGSSNFLQTAGVSTLSEFVSSQLSRLFTGLFEAALTDNGLIAGVDFDIGLIKNSSLLQQSSAGLAPDEIQVNFKNRFRFLNERLSFNLGGNYIPQSLADNASFFGLDFALEYFITNDRKLKLRMYGRSDIDQLVVDGRQEQYGFGLGYRTEFGTLADFQEGLKKSIKGVLE